MLEFDWGSSEIRFDSCSSLVFSQSSVSRKSRLNVPFQVNV